jgi:hypothetical protein
MGSKVKVGTPPLHPLQPGAWYVYEIPSAGLNHALLGCVSQSVVRGQLDLDDYPRSIAMPRNSSNLVIKHDVLTPGQEYELRVTVRAC